MGGIFGDTRQISYVSGDLDRALGYFTQSVGVGPWFIKRDYKVPGCRIDGIETEVVLDAALTFGTGLQLEVIVQKSKAPTHYSRFLDAYGDALIPHSTSSWVKDVEAIAGLARKRGFHQVFDATTGLGRIAYFEHPDRPKFAWEVAEYTSARQSIFRQIEEVATGWDGIAPFREDWPLPEV